MKSYILFNLSQTWMAQQWHLLPNLDIWSFDPLLLTGIKLSWNQCFLTGNVFFFFFYSLGCNAKFMTDPYLWPSLPVLDFTINFDRSLQAWIFLAFSAVTAALLYKPCSFHRFVYLTSLVRAISMILLCFFSTLYTLSHGLLGV